MKLSLTLVLLLAVTSSVSKAAKHGDFETVIEEAGDGETHDCPPQAKTVAKMLGGKVISQQLEQISTGIGCIWVLRGGTRRRFVNAANCGSCTVDDEDRVACSGPGVAMHRFCQLVRGPDCQLYPVGLLPHLPCVPCPRITRVETRVLGGNTISQQLVQISTLTGCIWALSGSTPQKFVNAKNCARYRVGNNNRIFAVGAGEAMHPFCQLVRGPDCQLHPVGDRPELPCVPCPRLAKLATKVLGGKTIRQRLVQLKTRLGCLWVLDNPGRTAENFVNSQNCARCTVDSKGVRCTGAGTAMHPVCSLKRGPDCQLYPVGASPELPCKKSP